MTSTPYLSVDVDRMLRNIHHAAAWAASHDVALRPHVKTHKSPTIAALQVAAGAHGIAVATVGEAEVFARHGFTDIFIAYPLWLDDDRAERVSRLAEVADLSLGLDSRTSAATLGRHLGSSVSVLIEIDSGHHRSGVAPEDSGALASHATKSGLKVRGVFTFPGHSYGPGAMAAAARDEAAALTRAAASLADYGVEAQVVSGGSTPSLAHTQTSALTELRPGVYVFGDAQQWELATIEPERIALTCRTTVVSHAGGRVVLDAGSKILGADRASYATGYGRLLDHPDARIITLSEHHAVVTWPHPTLPSIGSTLQVVPNHVCNAVNLVDVLYAEDASGARTWPVAARGRNS